MIIECILCNETYEDPRSYQQHARFYHQGKQNMVTDSEKKLRFCCTPDNVKNKCSKCGGPLETDIPHAVNLCGYCWEKVNRLGIAKAESEPGRYD